MPPAWGEAVVTVRGAIFGLLVTAALSGPTHAHGPAPSPADGAVLPPPEGAIYGAAFAAAEAGKHQTALKLAAKAHNSLADKLIDWLALSRAQPVPAFERFVAFIENNPDWPRLNALRRRAEAAIDATVGDERVFAWFAANPPRTGLGRARLAEAQFRAGNDETATALVRDAWIGGNFTRDEEKAFLAKHRKRLRREDHAARLDRLLWDGRRSASRRMLRRVDSGQRALAEARLRLMFRAGGVDAAIARVPDELLGDAGLRFERARWRRRHNMAAGAREILAAPPDDLVRPAAWWRESRIQSRQAVREGLISVAYRLASEHRQTASLPRSQAEWLAGWIALRFLSDAGRAHGHFTALRDGVSYPISVARAAYWAGRAAMAVNSRAGSRWWYGLAAQHPTTYYGQLALAALGATGALPLPEDPVVSADDAAFVYGHELTRVVQFLADAGEARLMRPFVLRLAELAGDAGRRAGVAAMAAAVGRPDLGMVVARRWSRDGELLVSYGYPVVSLPPSRSGAGEVEPALLLAMLRQESGFDAGAVSRAGARGLMQLMPGTARSVARSLKLSYDKERLTTDTDYNLTLGRAYVGGLQRRSAAGAALDRERRRSAPGRGRHDRLDRVDPTLRNSQLRSARARGGYGLPPYPRRTGAGTQPCQRPPARRHGAAQLARTSRHG